MAPLFDTAVAGSSGLRGQHRAVGGAARPRDQDNCGDPPHLVAVQTFLGVERPAFEVGRSNKPAGHRRGGHADGRAAGRR